MGDIGKIPTRVKKTNHNAVWRDPLNTKFIVEYEGYGKFIGFTVSGDNRYLGRDFTIMKNSGKTRLCCELCRRLALPSLWIAPTDRIVRQTQGVLESFFGKNYSFHLERSKDLKLGSGDGLGRYL